MKTSIKSKLLPVVILLLVAVIFTGCGGNTVEKSGATGTTVTQTTEPQPDTTNESNVSPTTSEANVMKLSSTAFQDGGTIPAKYAREGAGGSNISIPLEWTYAPGGTKSFALVIVDTSANNWVHWMAINIPAKTTAIAEGASGRNMPSGSKELANTFGNVGYGGPQPPQGSGVHDYETTIYALSTEKLELPQQTSYSDFLQAIEGKVLAKASVTGTFSR